MENSVLSTVGVSDLSTQIQQDNPPRSLGTTTTIDSIQPSSDTPYISSNLIDTNVPPSPANPTALSSQATPTALSSQATPTALSSQATPTALSNTDSAPSIGQGIGRSDKKRYPTLQAANVSTLDIEENPRDRLATVRNRIDIEPDNNHGTDRNRDANRDSHADRKSTPSNLADSSTRYITPINIYRPSLLVPRLASVDPYDVVDYFGTRRTEREEANRLKSRVDELEKRAAKPTSLSVTLSRKTAKAKPKTSTKSKSKTRSTTKPKASRAKSKSSRAKSKSKTAKAKPKASIKSRSKTAKTK